jgi:hypothetical protein
MVRRLDRFGTTLVGLGLVTLLVAGCGGTTSTSTPSQTASQAPTVSVRPSDTAGASGSVASASAASPTVSPSPGPTYLAHLDAALEDQLPSVVGGLTLTKFSYPVSTYLASVTGGDSVLYAPWLVKFGKTPDAVDMAFAEDDLPPVHFNLRAIQVPGADATTLVAALSDVATKAGWPVTTNDYPKQPLVITDPTADATKAADKAYVHAKGDVVFFVVGNPSLDLASIVQALAALP